MSTGRSPEVRPPAVAGTFYPDDPDELTDAVRSAMAAAGPPPPGSVPPHAVVAPHAGYVFSGTVAASAYVAVAARRGEVSRVVLLGPNHRVPLRSVALPTVDAFSTPLGPVPVDRAACEALLDLPGVELDDGPHEGEHGIEVHLPFLQLLLGDGWSLVPMVVGQVEPAVVAEVLDRLWGGPETLVVVSTDLSHYHDHVTARRLDAATAAAVVARRWRDLGPGSACGAHPLRGLLLEAERRDLPVELLDLRTSGDTAGDRRRVVGYGAFSVG